jgi:hypothetical protein
VAIPRPDFSAQGFQIGDPPASGALPRQDADLDLNVVEPTPVSRRIVNRKSAPDLAAEIFSEQISKELTVVDVQIIRQQLYGSGLRIPHDDDQQTLRTDSRGCCSDAFRRHAAFGNVTQYRANGEQSE